MYRINMKLHKSSQIEVKFLELAEKKVPILLITSDNDVRQGTCLTWLHSTRRNFTHNTPVTDGKIIKEKLV